MIRTLIAEPVMLTRAGLVALLGREGDVELAFTAQLRPLAIAKTGARNRVGAIRAAARSGWR